MGWHNWPYWLKGGIIFLIFPVIGLYGGATCQEFECLIYLPFSGAIMFIEPHDSLWSRVIFTVVNFMFYLILGSIIGLIYGKSKSKNNTNTTASEPKKKQYGNIILVILGVFLLYYNFVLYIPYRIFIFIIALLLIIIGIGRFIYRKIENRKSKN